MSDQDDLVAKLNLRRSVTLLFAILAFVLILGTISLVLIAHHHDNAALLILIPGFALALAFPKLIDLVQR